MKLYALFRNAVQAIKTNNLIAATGGADVYYQEAIEKEERAAAVQIPHELLKTQV